MKKLLFGFIAIMLSIACSNNKQSKAAVSKDSMVTVFCNGDTDRFEISLDSFLQIKDSFVYCKEEGLWMTKELYKWNYGFPDTITVAFTRNGQFEDSVQAIRGGDHICDENGNAYSPGYVFMAAVGDTWVYDINGKFIKFYCTSLPHSGQTHHYSP